MSSADTITGGCACGAVRYECSSEVVLAVNCHCRDCQRASGSAFAALRVVWADGFRLLGDAPKYYTRQSDAGNTMQRGFCAECGSPLTILEPHRPKLVFIHVAGLDDPGLHQPSMNIYVDSAHAWDFMDPALETFAGMPPVPDGFGA